LLETTSFDVLIVKIGAWAVGRRKNKKTIAELCAFSHIWGRK